MSVLRWDLGGGFCGVECDAVLHRYISVLMCRFGFRRVARQGFKVPSLRMEIAYPALTDWFEVIIDKHNVNRLCFATPRSWGEIYRKIMNHTETLRVSATST